MNSLRDNISSPIPDTPHFLRVGYNAGWANSPDKFSIQMKVKLPELAPFVPFPIQSVNVNGHVFPQQTGQNTMKGIHQVYDKNHVHSAKQHVEHGHQRVRQCAHCFGFNTWQVNQPHSLIGFRPIRKQTAPAVDNHFVTSGGMRVSYYALARDAKTESKTDRTIRNESGRTPLQQARHFGHARLARALQ